MPILRNIIVHCHMFKNAGSSVDWSLQRNFGEGFIDHREDKQMRTEADYLSKYLIENPSVTALSSHHITMPVPKIVNVNIFPLMLFRHPIERIGSVYAFEKKQDVETPGAINAKRLSFSEYVKWRMEKNTGATIRNFQTRCCLGKITKPGQDLSDDDYRVAVQVVNDTKLIGLVEKYNHSMVYMEEVMSDYFPDLDLSYVKQNVNQVTGLSMDDKIDALFDKLDTESIDLLLENNKYDLLLYQYARAVFFKRYNGINDPELKMSDFVNRCNNIETITE